MNEAIDTLDRGLNTVKGLDAWATLWILCGLLAFIAWRLTKALSMMYQESRQREKESDTRLDAVHDTLQNLVQLVKEWRQ